MVAPMRAGLVGLVIAGLCGCGVSGSIDGMLSAEVDVPATKWTMTPTRCVSGEHAGFFGVDLIAGDDEDTLVRVLHDPIDGYAFGTNIPGTEQSLFIDAAAGCELFDVALAREDSRVNNYWNMTGHALIDCSLRELELHVDISFSGCH